MGQWWAMKGREEGWWGIPVVMTVKYIGNPTVSVKVKEELVSKSDNEMTSLELLLTLDAVFFIPVGLEGYSSDVSRVSSGAMVQSWSGIGLGQGRRLIDQTSSGFSPGGCYMYSVNSHWPVLSV